MADHAPAARLQSPHLQALLDAVRYQGQSNDCGPYTTATVLKALRGIDLDPADLARRMERPVWRGPVFVVRRFPNWATFPWGIADVLGEHGMRARWSFFNSPWRLWEGLEAGLAVMPVIGSWRPLWAHVMTLVAWDPAEGWGFANTQFDNHQIHWVADAVFAPRWRAMARLAITAE